MKTLKTIKTYWTIDTCIQWLKTIPLLELDQIIASVKIMNEDEDSDNHFNGITLAFMLQNRKSSRSKRIRKIMQLKLKIYQTFLKEEKRKKMNFHFQLMLLCLIKKLKKN